MKKSRVHIAFPKAAAAVLAALLLLSGCAKNGGTVSPTEVATQRVSGSDAPATETTEAAIEGTELLPGVTVSDLFPYTGKYVEDGSDDPVENMAAVTLTNRGGTDYLYLEFSVKTQSGEYAFTASSVHVGTVTTVLSKEKKTCGAEESVLSADCPIHAEYQSPPTMCEDRFALTQAPGSFSIRNISGADLNGTITVYYKCTDENGFLGGITFRTAINGLKADEEQWMPSTHMGEIVFITYEE